MLLVTVYGFGIIMVEEAGQHGLEVLGSDGHHGRQADGRTRWSLNIMVIIWYHPANYWDFQEWV
jgi:hypothetical protein